jgi:PAS domain S-box-containing protein
MTHSAEQLRILHVDDEASFREVTASYLEREREQFIVEIAPDAQTGLDRLDEETVDCIVSDYNMPGENGIEFLESVRDSYPDIPFILFTGKGSEEVAADAISAGATDYIQKSGDASQYTVLANRIENAVETFRKTQQIAQANRRRRRMLERITDGFAQLDGELLFTDVNDQAIEYTGIEREELLGTNYSELGIEQGESPFLTAYREVLETGEPRTVVAESDFDSERWLKERIFPAENDDGLFVYFRDITKQKKREQLQNIIIEVSSRLINVDTDKIDDRIRDGLTQIGEFADADRCYVFEFSNDQTTMSNTYEWSAEGVDPQKPELQDLETPPFSWFFPKTIAGETVTVSTLDDLPGEASVLKSTLEAGNIESILTVPMIQEETVQGFIGLDWFEQRDTWPEETLGLLEVCGNIIASALNRTETVLERDRHEQRLQEQRQLYKTLVEQSPNGVLIVQDKEIQFANGQMEALTGLGEDELLGRHFSTLMTPEYRELVEQRYEKRLQGDQPPQHYELDVQTKDGETQPVTVHVSRIQYHDRPAALATFDTKTEP